MEDFSLKLEIDWFGRELPSLDYCLLIYEHSISLHLLGSAFCHLLTGFSCTPLLWINSLLFSYALDLAKPSKLGQFTNMPIFLILA